MDTIERQSLSEVMIGQAISNLEKKVVLSNFRIMLLLVNCINFAVHNIN